jgi:putative transposase
MCFLQNLRRLMRQYGSQNIVYFDESGFTAESYRPHGWAPRGQKVFGSISGNNRKATNLIMAQRKNQWLAPMLFTGSCHTEIVNQWIAEMLLPELAAPSVIIMDNARFHNKEQMNALLERAGHTMLPLPRYSPDFNPIEQSFATIKKRRMFAHNQNLEDIIVGNY